MDDYDEKAWERGPLTQRQGRLFTWTKFLRPLLDAKAPQRVRTSNQYRSIDGIHVRRWTRCHSPPKRRSTN